MKKIEQKIIKWIQQKIAESHTKGIVVGLSGGIDSAVVSVLALKVVGKENLIGVIMPCDSNKQDKEDAWLVAKKFGIKTITVNLSGTNFDISRNLPKGNRLAQANLKARLRMSTLYFFANNYNYMVCGTGNKTEIAIGYYTKYGDGGVDIEPIGDLYKTDVRELAKYLGIPAQIITKPPSAGLWEGQTDEKEMGITYKKLDEILSDIENGVEYKMGFAPENVKKVYDMINNSEHKRNIPPICQIN